MLVFVVLCLTIVAVFTALFPTKYANYVEKYSKIYGVDKNLVYAVIRCESGFDHNAKSKKGAVGLMQLMPSTASWCAKNLGVDFTEEMLCDPEFNIKIGVYYLSYLSARFDTVDKVVMAYNAGEGNVKNWLQGNGKVFSETSAYLKRVKFAKEVYRIFSALDFC